MTSEQKVKKVYPRAFYAECSERVYSWEKGCALSCDYADERRAWADAWRGIQELRKEESL